MTSTDSKPNRRDQREARRLQKELGIKYTKALRFVKNKGNPPTAEGMQIIGLMIEKGLEEGLGGINAASSE